MAAKPSSRIVNHSRQIMATVVELITGTVSLISQRIMLEMFPTDAQTNESNTSDASWRIYSSDTKNVLSDRNIVSQLAAWWSWDAEEHPWAPATVSPTLIQACSPEDGGVCQVATMAGRLRRTLRASSSEPSRGCSSARLLQNIPWQVYDPRDL